MPELQNRLAAVTAEGGLEGYDSRFAAVPTIDDFSGVLVALLSDPSLFTGSASEALRRLLTFDGRLPVEHAMESLEPLDEALYHAASEAGSVSIGPLPQPSRAVGDVIVYISSLGRVHIRPAAAPVPAYPRQVSLFPVATFELGEAALAKAQGRAIAVGAAEGPLRRRLDNWLEGVERAGRTGELLAAVDDSVRHVEAVYFYADDELLCNMEGLSTLVGKSGDGGVLATLRETPVATWTPGRRLAVACLRLLFLSGRSVRFEEFNGKALTAARFFALFDRLSGFYESIGSACDGGEPERWAAEIGRLAFSAAGAPVLRYRWISGVTYLKTERVTAPLSSEELDGAVPEWVHARYARRVGSSGSGSSWAVLFASLADEAIARTLAGEGAGDYAAPALTPLEELIQEVVASACERTAADYSMSSSLRNPALLLGANEATRRDAVLTLKPANFYCCVCTRPGLRSLVGERTAGHVYQTVQARMQFNRWHFVAGNYHNVPHSRHFFYPPVVPDLAEWSDLRHGGHAKASVRYSVRSPGPDISEPPLVIAGHPYRGFYDIRVVRMAGPPFGLRELHAARCHQLWMGVIWRRIIDIVEGGTHPLVIKGFETGKGYELPGRDWSSPRKVDSL